MKDALNVCIAAITLVLFLLVSGCGKTDQRSHLTSDPSGAIVFYNNKVVGQTPCDVVMHQRQGDYNIYTFRAVKEDYMPERKSYKEELYHQGVTDVIPESLHFELRKREIYQIHITSDPTGAVIALNGEVIGETPVTAEIKERIGDSRVFSFVAIKEGFDQVEKELKEFLPKKDGTVYEFPETMHFDLEN